MDNDLYNEGMKPEHKKWLVRVLIGIVVFFNLDAAFSFMLQPERYSPGFELIGVPGQAVIQGMGLLFLMWNVPYIVAMLDPNRAFRFAYRSGGDAGDWSFRGDHNSIDASGKPSANRRYRHTFYHL